MRKLILAVSAAALVAAPAMAFAEKSPAQEKEKPGLVTTVAGAVGGVVATTAGTAAGGPLGGAAAGIAGQKVGRGLGGFVDKLFGKDKDKDKAEAAEAKAPPPAAEEPPIFQAEVRPEIVPPPLAVPEPAAAPSAGDAAAEANAIEALPQDIPPVTDSGAQEPPPGAEVLDVRATPD
jgi:hypothetical protein